MRFILLNALVGALLLTSCSQSSTLDRQSVETAHGLKLPLSARNFQQASSGTMFDRGILSFVEIDTTELKGFVSSLKINGRSRPTNSGAANPLVNGYNVWPQNSLTFVPGNIGKLKRTWAREATPVEMLSCASPKGDWLHVEIWAIGEATLVKLYTDWN